MFQAQLSLHLSGLGLTAPAAAVCTDARLPNAVPDSLGFIVFL